MARLPLLGGAYSARSIIANAQRCVNLFPEKNAVAAPVPLTHYQRPGLRPLAQGTSEPVRGLYRASNGNGYCVIGSGVYAINPSWVLTLLGSVTPGRTNPTSMIDNGIEILLVDGSTSGWTIQLASNMFAPVVDGTGTFVGADRVDYIDTFILFNFPGTDRFGSTHSGSPLVFDPLYFAAKSGYPDPLMNLIVNRHEFILVGALKTEVWYNAGLSNFPFAELPGAYFEHGAVSRYSIAAMDISVFWLGQDLQGQGVVFRARGYIIQRISNFAVEFQIRKMANSVGIDDVIGYCYQQDGHWFYVLQFPKGDQTWVFDDSLQADPDIAWHQEAWTDGDGQLRRHRGNCHAFINGQNVVGDWENGTLYAMDLDVYTDSVGGVPMPISRIRTFPHIGTGEVEIAQFGARPVMANGHRVQFREFIADIECGMTVNSIDNRPPVIALRYSDDRGRTWSSDILQSGGAQGEFLTWPTWRGLGIARDRVFELAYSHDGPAALNGAWVEAQVLES